MLSHIKKMISETDASSKIHQVPRAEHAQALDYLLETGKNLLHFAAVMTLRPARI